VKKITQNVAQSIFVIFNVEKVAKKLPKVNNHPLGEISPNLVTW
jgi:hypothetical protein